MKINPTNGIRGYKNKVRAGGLNLNFKPAQAGFVCVGAISIASTFKPAQAGFVCVGAISIASL